MAETKTKKQDKKSKDSRGDEIDMSANIPEEQEGWEDKDRDMSAKHNDLGEGHHKNSKTFGIVTSHYAPDAAGLTPEDLHERVEAHMGHDEDEIKAKEERAEASVQRMEERKEERQQARAEQDEDSK